MIGCFVKRLHSTHLPIHPQSNPSLVAAFLLKNQAEKNGGELVMLFPKGKVESLSTPQNDLSSDSKDTEKDSSGQENRGKYWIAKRKSKQGIASKRNGILGPRVIG